LARASPIRIRDITGRGSSVVVCRAGQIRPRVAYRENSHGKRGRQGAFENSTYAGNHQLSQHRNVLRQVATEGAAAYTREFILLRCQQRPRWAYAGHFSMLWNVLPKPRSCASGAGGEPRTQDFASHFPSPAFEPLAVDRTKMECDRDSENRQRVRDS